MTDIATRVTAANLIRYAVKYMDRWGWQREGVQGVQGQVCPLLALVKSAQENEFGVLSEPVRVARDYLIEAAEKLDARELSDYDGYNAFVRYNEHPNRNAHEVKNFMGHVANTMVRSKKPKKVA